MPFARVVSHQAQESIVAHPSHTLPALALSITVQPSLDPLRGCDPWASAIAWRLVQQTQIPFWPGQHQGSEVWTHSCQSQPWQTPRWPFELTHQNLQEPRGLASNDWQSSSSPLVPPAVPQPPTWNATPAGFASAYASRQHNLRSGLNLIGRGYPGGGQSTMEITDRDPIPKWDFQEPGARLRPWLRELSFTET